MGAKITILNWGMSPGNYPDATVGLLGFLSIAVISFVWILKILITKN